MAKKPQLNIQLEPEWRLVFDEIHELSGLNDQAIVRAFIHTLVRHYRANGKIAFPLDLQDAKGKLLKPLPPKRRPETPGDSASEEPPKEEHGS